MENKEIRVSTLAQASNCGSLARYLHEGGTFFTHVGFSRGTLLHNRIKKWVSGDGKLSDAIKKRLPPLKEILAVEERQKKSYVLIRSK